MDNQTKEIQSDWSYVVQECMKGTASWYDVKENGTFSFMGTAVKRANSLGFNNHMFKYRVIRRTDVVVTEQLCIT